MKSLSILSPAKINLCLRVLDRKKNGYHNILSIFQTISLYDKITVKLLKENKIVIKSNVKSLQNKKNLCYKVAELIKKKYKVRNGVEINLKKNIPLGSGLGGASSNAMSVLLGLVKLWNIKIKKEEIISLSSKIGKDLPFFYYKGCCLVSGMGEKVEAVKPWWRKRGLWFVLIYPNKKLMTRDVYSKFDEISNNQCGKKVSYSMLKKLIRKKCFFKELIFNDLYTAAVNLFPKLEFIKNKILQSISDKKLVNMSGSGSTLYTVFFSYKDASKFVKILKHNLSGSRVELVRTIF